MNMLEAALRIAKVWPVFPCVSLPGLEGDKKPLTPHGFKDATKDEKQIRKWWKRWPNAMIAVPMGPASGVWAIDPDVPKEPGDPDGVAEWEETVAVYGMPPTRTHETPSGGRHVLFRWDPKRPVTNSPGVLPDGVDVRGEGGYIIVPPSHTADGREYKSNGCGTIAEAPEWVYFLVLPPEMDAKEQRQIEEELKNEKSRAGEQRNRFRDINHAAMANLSAWVPHLFPAAKPYKNGYRVSSKALGRKLQEDLSILPIGIMDWGVYDQGDPRGGKRTPIDLVMEWGHKDLHAAAAWLAERLGIEAPTKAKPDSGKGEQKQDAQAADGSQHETWPTMDDAAYHGFAGEFVRTISPHSEADPVALLVQFLICFGSIVGRCSYYQVESDRHYTNLFAALVGQTSRGRKGTSFGRVMAVARGADPQWSDNNMKGGLSSGEGLIHAVRDPVLKWDKDKSAMVEVDHGVHDKRLLLVEPEFAGVLAVMARGGSTTSPLLRKAWDGGKLATMTRTSPLTATNAHISAIGHITVHELRSHLTRTDMASGFANRFLFALIRRSKELPFGGDLTDSEVQRLGEELKHIVESACGEIASAPRITMTEEARALWSQRYSSLTTDQPGLLGALIARAEAQTIRLALIYALLDRKKQIDTVHLRAALAIWEYCEASTAHIFGTAVGDEMADEILRSLVANRGGMSRTMIYEIFGGHKSRTRISAALALLHEKGLARMTTQPTQGRPVETWFPI